MGRLGSRVVAVVAASMLTVVGAGVVVVLGATSAGAAVTTEAGFRAAWTAGGTIDLGNNINLTCTDGGGDGVAITNLATPIVVNGHGFTLTQTCTTGTNNAVLEQFGAGALTFQSITVTGGNTSLSGGGIAAVDGNVTLTNSTVSGNSAGVGGGVLSATGNVTLTNSTVSGNTSTTIFGGGIAAVDGNVTLTSSTVSGNRAANGGGIVVLLGTVSLTNSTVSGNTATSAVGGIGAACRTGARGCVGNVSLTNSTVSGNTATTVVGGIDANSVSLVYATVVGNTGPSAANIGSGVGPSTSYGSVVALPHGGPNCLVASLTSTGYNWDDDGSCGFGAGPGDHSNAGSPGLGALANNGGPTQTLLPLAGSGLIDAIPNAGCQGGITTDQRGFARPDPASSACDIGAVEVQLAAPVTPAAVVVTPRFTG
jgi:predicted outer membrane repeat protein